MSQLLTESTLLSGSVKPVYNADVCATVMYHALIGLKNWFLQKLTSQCIVYKLVSHSSSSSSAVIGQLKRSHDTEGENLSLSDVQKTLYQSDITHNMR